MRSGANATLRASVRCLVSEGLAPPKEAPRQLRSPRTSAKARPAPSDSLDHCLVDKLEAPHASAETLDVEEVKPREVLDPAELDVEFDLIAVVDAALVSKGTRRRWSLTAEKPARPERRKQSSRRRTARWDAKSLTSARRRAAHEGLASPAWRVTARPRTPWAMRDPR
jgi:hypothetical protein